MNPTTRKQFPLLPHNQKFTHFCFCSCSISPNFCNDANDDDDDGDDDDDDGLSEAKSVSDGCPNGFPPGRDHGAFYHKIVGDDADDGGDNDVINICSVVFADVCGDGDGRDGDGASCHMVAEVFDGDDLIVIIVVVSTNGMIMMMVAVIMIFFCCI